MRHLAAVVTGSSQAGYSFIKATSFIKASGHRPAEVKGGANVAPAVAGTKRTRGIHAVFDVAIIGLGVMGSAAAESLARRGWRVVGIERFARDMIAAPRTARRGSSGSAISNIPPMCRCCAPPIRCGGISRRGRASGCYRHRDLEMGAPESELVAGTLDASRLHAVPHEILDAQSLMRRFPAFRVPQDFVGVFQPHGGLSTGGAPSLRMQRLARRAGAELRFGGTGRRGHAAT